MQISYALNFYRIPFHSAYRRSVWATVLFVALSVLFTLGCEDTTANQSEGEACDTLSSSCPEGTTCQLDAVGNPFCAPMSDPPLNIGGMVSDNSTPGNGQTIRPLGTIV